MKRAVGENIFGDVKIIFPFFHPQRQTIHHIDGWVNPITPFELCSEYTAIHEALRWQRPMVVNE